MKQRLNVKFRSEACKLPKKKNPKHLLLSAQGGAEGGVTSAMPGLKKDHKKTSLHMASAGAV